MAKKKSEGGGIKLPMPPPAPRANQVTIAEPVKGSPLRKACVAMPPCGTLSVSQFKDSETGVVLNRHWHDDGGCHWTMDADDWAADEARFGPQVARQAVQAAPGRARKARAEHGEAGGKHPGQAPWAGTTAANVAAWLGLQGGLPLAIDAVAKEDGVTLPLKRIKRYIRQGKDGKRTTVPQDVERLKAALAKAMAALVTVEVVPTLRKKLDTDAVRIKSSKRNRRRLNLAGARPVRSVGAVEAEAVYVRRPKGKPLRTTTVRERALLDMLAKAGRAQVRA